MKMKKALRILIMAMFFLGVMTRSVFASEIIPPSFGTIQPFWDNVSALTCSLSFYDTTADCSAKVTGYSGTTKIEATLTLQQKTGGSWYDVASWNKNSFKSYVAFTEEYDVSSGYDYRLVLEADVYRNGSWESVSKTSAVKRCG